MIEKIENGFRLFGLTLIIPITFTIVNILLCGIIGLESRYGFIYNFKIIWIDYYFTGSLLDVAAWRWHLGVLSICFLISFFANDW